MIYLAKPRWFVDFEKTLGTLYLTVLDFSLLQRVTWPSDEIKILSGMSQCHRGEKSIEMVQYTQWLTHEFY